MQNNFCTIETPATIMLLIICNENILCNEFPQFYRTMETFDEKIFEKIYVAHFAVVL